MISILGGGTMPVLKGVQFSQFSLSFVQVAFFFGELTWVAILSWHLPLLKAAAASYGDFERFSFGSRLRSSGTVDKTWLFLVSVKKIEVFGWCTSTKYWCFGHFWWQVPFLAWLVWCTVDPDILIQWFAFKPLCVAQEQAAQEGETNDGKNGKMIESAGEFGSVERWRFWSMV